MKPESSTVSKAVRVYGTVEIRLSLASDWLLFGRAGGVLAMLEFTSRALFFRAPALDGGALVCRLVGIVMNKCHCSADGLYKEDISVYIPGALIRLRNVGLTNICSGTWRSAPPQSECSTNRCWSAPPQSECSTNRCWSAPPQSECSTSRCWSAPQVNCARNNLTVRSHKTESGVDLSCYAVLDYIRYYRRIKIPWTKRQFYW
jgi:hypothetical protein